MMREYFLLFMNQYNIMTWKHIFTLALVPLLVCAGAPFVELNTVHEAYSEFQVNLIFNENRNHPIIVVTVSRDESKDAVKDVLERAFRIQPYSAFAILVDCRKYESNLNHTLALCSQYSPDQPVEEGNEVRENHHESASKSEPQN